MYLSLENILKEATEESIYWYYLGDRVDYKKSYRVPWRKDGTPSLKFFKHRNNSRLLKIWWRDVTRDVSGDAINMIQNMYNIDFYESLIRVNIDLSLGLSYDTSKYSMKRSSKPPVKLDYVAEENNTKLSFQLNKYKGNHIYTKADLNYWKKRGINKEDLKKENIYSVSRVYASGSPIWTYHKNNPIFLYSYSYNNKEYFKLYRPLMKNKNKKWLSNLNSVSTLIIDGLGDIPDFGDILIITKSKKDKMVLNKLGFTSISIQSESTFIHPDLWETSDLHNRFRWVFNLFDNDEAGLRMGKQFSEIYGTLPIWLPEEFGNDIDEVIVNLGKEDTINILNSIL